jgi:hypothetical protein
MTELISQQPFEASGIPLWVWLVGVFLVILVGVIWTLYEEEGRGVRSDGSEIGSSAPLGAMGDDA